MTRSLGELEIGSLADWVSGLGSLAAVAIALCGYWVVARQREADRRDRERAVAYELVAVLMELSNNVLTIRKHIRQARNDMAIPSANLHFRIINPLIGLSSEGEVRLPPGSAELLIKASAADLWNQAVLLANHNRALVSILKEYRGLWAETMARLPPPDFTSSPGKFRTKTSEFETVKPELIKLDAIVASLESQSDEAAALAQSVADAIGPILKSYFKETILQLHPSTAESPSSDQPK